jgi:hypothetical protein
MKLKLITCVVAALVTMQIVAQMKLENRIEFELKKGYSNQKIYRSLDGHFVLESRADKKEQNNLEIKYDLYNSNLKEVKSTSVYVPSKMHETVTCNDDTCIYVMYRSGKRDFMLSRVRINDLKTDVQNGKLPKGLNLIDMKVLGSKAWFEAKKRNKTCLLQIDLNSGNSQVSENIEKKWNNKTNIVNYQLAPKSGELLMFVNKYIKKGICELSQVRVNEACELCDNIQLTGAGDKVISAVSGCRISDKKMVYTGTYSGKNQYTSEGMFFAEAENSKLKFIKYINFLDMDHFLSFMPEKKQEKIMKKKNREENKGKEYTISYDIATHDIIQIPGGYLLVGEAYYPVYSSIPFTTTTMMNGIMMMHTSYNQVFDGYSYTHAFIARFSDNGELMWDQCFEMSPSEYPKYVKRFIRVSEQTDKDIAMVFASGNFMVSKIIDFDGNIVKDVKTELIATGKETEKTNWTTSNAEYWFGNNFLVYGSQRVKDTEDKSRRKVFFVNKLSF